MHGALLSSRFSRTDRAAAVIVALYLILASAYSIVVPIFEAPDEAQHFFFVREIIEGHGLPVQQTGVNGRWVQEGSQPPLYYLIGAALTFWTDAGNWAEANRRNPYAVQGDPQANGNRNVYLHGPQDDFPWHGTTLAVHALRFVSILIGALSIIVTYALARTLFPAQPVLALGAAAIHAFLPQFVFISAAVNNDALAALTCGAALLQAVRVANGAARRGDDWLLGLLVGLAALTKLSGAGMAAIAVAALLLTAQGQSMAAWRTVTVRLIRVTVIAAVVAGWWYARNLVLYGDVTGLNRMLAIVGVRNPPPDVWQLLDEMEGLRLSFWGLFGWFSILLPPGVYQWFDWIALVGLAGLAVGLAVDLVRWKQLKRLPPLLLVPLVFGIVLVGVIRWGALTPGLQGRLLFPALAACAVMLAAGLSYWVRQVPNALRVLKVASYLPLWLLISFPAISAAALPAVIAPAYARPELHAASNSTGVTRWIGRDTIMLVRAETTSGTLYAGDSLPLTLVWQVDQMPSQDDTLFIKVYGLNDELIAGVDTFPGNGMFPTTLWSAHQEIVDVYHLRISSAARTPAYAKVVVGWYERTTGQALPPYSPAGQRIVRPVVARVKLAPANPPLPGHPLLNTTFGKQIALTGYDLASGQVTLYWKALDTLPADYTVFIHALDQSGNVVAQSDGQPQNGDYPTSAWAKDAWVVDAHALDLPPQAVRLEIGLYQRQSGVRLPVDGQGHDSVLIELPR